jgi:ABC-type nitrate/sulfonate/bicarbonate transport system substrate-binding protein
MKFSTNISVVGVFGITCLLFACGRRANNEVTFANATEAWWTAPTIITETHDLFSKQGLKVRSFEVMTGLASKNAVVSGTADFGLVAATPLAMGAYQKEQVAVLCSYVESKYLITLVRRKQADGVADGIPQPIAIVPRTISEWYFVNYLKRHNLNERRREFQELHVNPTDISNVLNRGGANSAVIWEPFGSMMSPSEFEIVRDPDLYTLRLFLICRPELIKNHPDTVRRFVAAVSEASNLIANDEDRIRAELETRYHLSSGALRPLWAKVDFSVKFDFDKMQELVAADAKLAAELGYAKAGALPDVSYLFPKAFTQ